MGTIKIAQIIGRTANGGVENTIMNYYRYIDRSIVQFDFFVESPSKIIDISLIESMGGKVFLIPSVKNFFKYNKALRLLFHRKNYHIVQANINSLSVFPLRIAKKCGIQIRIANSLSTSNKGEPFRNFVKFFLRLFSKKYATHYFACSNLAGEWLFGKKALHSNKFYLIRNAVDTNIFIFRERIKKELSEKHNLLGQTIVGNVGRFEKQKNHLFLLDIFKEFINIRPNSHLVLIGDGKLKDKIIEKAVRLGIGNKILILTSDDVGVGASMAKYYSLFDVFVLPSLYEGLPTVGVEAQLASLPTFFASTITKEAKISDDTYFIDLDEKPAIWASKINLALKKYNRQSVTYSDDFNIKTQATKILKIYKSFLEKSL